MNKRRLNSLGYLNLKSILYNSDQVIQIVLLRNHKIVCYFHPVFVEHDNFWIWTYSLIIYCENNNYSCRYPLSWNSSSLFNLAISKYLHLHDFIDICMDNFNILEPQRNCTVGEIRESHDNHFHFLSTGVFTKFGKHADRTQELYVPLFQ